MKGWEKAAIWIAAGVAWLTIAGLILERTGRLEDRMLHLEREFANLRTVLTERVARLEVHHGIPKALVSSYGTTTDEEDTNGG